MVGARRRGRGGGPGRFARLLLPGATMPAATDKKAKAVTNKEKQVKRDPVVPSSNKLVSARWEDKCREIHLQKLKNMKPAIDNVPPKEYPHLTNNKKRMQLQEGAHGPSRAARRAAPSRDAGC